MAAQQTLASRVRDLRLARGISQAQLAKPTFSDSYISLIEAGKRTPSPDVIHTLAERLDCSAAYLEYGIGEEELADLKIGLQHAHNALNNGQVAEALKAFSKALRVPNLVVYPGFYRRARTGYALALEASGQVQAAIAELEEVADAAEDADWEEWAELHTTLLRCRRQAGEVTASIEVAEQALARLASVGADITDGAIHLGVAVVDAYLHHGDLLLARQLVGRLVRTAEEFGGPQGQLDAYRQAASVAEACGDHERAVKLAERALTILTEDEQVRALARLRIYYARLLLTAHPEQADRARALLQHHEEMGGAAADGLACLIELARAEIAMGSPEGAVARAQQVISMVAGSVCRVGAYAHAVLGSAYEQLDKHEDAISAFTRSADDLDQVGLPHEAARAWIKVAELLGRGAAGHEQAASYRRALSSIGLIPPKD